MQTQNQLLRRLTLLDTTALVVGTVIGTGVFLKAAPMAQATHTPMLVILAWVAAGFLSLAGALTYAELAAMQPEAGGEYVYLKSSYGRAAAFFFGWQRFVVAGSASIASLGTGFAIFSLTFFNFDQTAWLEREIGFFGEPFTWRFGLQQVLAISVIMFMTLLNCFSVAFGGRVQSFLTILKLAGIAFLIVGTFAVAKTGSWSNFQKPAGAESWCGFALFGTAMLAALWGYDGWNNMPMAAGEVRDPERNIPRALILGTLCVMAIYCTLNLAYFYVLPFDEIVTARSNDYPQAMPVAAKAGQSFLGDFGGRFISLVFMLSAFGAMNGSILSNARVPFAMARDGMFFKNLSTVHETSRVPVRCLIVQGIWASVLAASGTFDQLTDCLLFASWIFYGFTTSSVFIMRWRYPDMPRPYKTLGYPIVPLVFVAVAIWLVINTYITKPVESRAGLLLMALGIPFYIYFSLVRPKGEESKPVADASA